MIGQRIVNNILGTKPKTDRKSKNNDRKTLTKREADSLFMSGGTLIGLDIPYEEAKSKWDGDTSSGSSYVFWRNKGDDHETAVIKAVQINR